ncbi:MAG TPA: 16S rRNA (guanine(527)-N(7))-methyltransferase RsmG [Kofleriaceae bacterium]|nr:16S rRNA (guanine(527)-N(7))-methyltransferase RsmG [Kofleriaceae bacterium]
MSRIAETLAALDLPPTHEAKLHQFSQLFHKWNRSINLSAATTDDEIRSHIADSLHVVPHVLKVCSAAGPSEKIRVLDVGSGGGFPCVVIAVSVPDAEVTALEPVHKKHAFLRTVARELSLPNLHPRAERLDRHPLRDYDIAVSRATFDLADWLIAGLAHVRPGGTVLGFEAVPRSDLPPDTQRYSYRLDEKSRSIVVLQRPL